MLSLGTHLSPFSITFEACSSSGVVLPGIMASSLFHDGPGRVSSLQEPASSLCFLGMAQP